MDVLVALRGTAGSREKGKAMGEHTRVENMHGTNVLYFSALKKSRDPLPGQNSRVQHQQGMPGSRAWRKVHFLDRLLSWSGGIGVELSGTGDR
jgi:hypothetical protein